MSPRTRSRAPLVPWLLLAGAALAPRASEAADWPTWRADAGRTGWTPESPPRGLRPLWARRPAGSPVPAWSGRDTRMSFDRAQRLAAAGGRVFVGSSSDFTVRALDAATGAQLWRFHTEAPVRLGISVHGGRVLAPSDDGHLYCLSASDGSLVWKIRPGPSDDRVLGNGLVVSRWPVRGGPVIRDGAVYFAGGIWPSEGIHVLAADVATGTVRWRNDASGSIRMPQPHGGAEALSGISAQGDLAISGDRLLVPTGRAVPAALRLEDGGFLWFHLQRYGQRGGSAILGEAGRFAAGGALFDAGTGEMLLERFGDGPVAAAPDVYLVAAGKEVRAYDRREPFVREETVDRRGQKAVRALPAPPRWRTEAGFPVEALIVAGDSIVIGGASRIAVLDLETREPRLEASVDGTALDLAVADGRLLASTDTGTIACFGSGAGSGGEAGPRGRPEEAPAGERPDEFGIAAREILDRYGSAEGYAVDLASGEGDLALALATRSRLHVVAVERDPGAAAGARDRLERAGLLGTRVAVLVADPARTPLPSGFANLVVSGRSVVEGPDAAPASEIFRLQRPWGGVTLVGRPGSMDRTVRGALPGAGAWTHQYGDAASTGSSADTVAAGPLGVLWFTDWGFPVPSRHGRAPAPLCLEGLLYVEGLDGILCADAYNGRKVWEHPLPGILAAYDQEHLMGTAGTGSNLCLADTGLYVRTGSRCLRLDRRTGKVLGEFPVPADPDGGAGTWGAIACSEGMLLGTLSDTGHVVQWRYREGDMSSLFTESRLLFAMGPEDGAVRWTHRPRWSVRHNAIALGAGRVHLIDRPAALLDRLQPPAARNAADAGAKPPHPPGELVALGARDGAVIWRSPPGIVGTMLALSVEHDVLLVAHQVTRFRLDSEVGGRLAAYRASTGAPLWDVPADYESRPVIQGTTIWAQPGAWDLRTGVRRDVRLARSYGCGTISASPNLLLFRSATLGYVDLRAGGETESYGGIRPGCWINAIPAGGLVLVPDATDRCVCSYLIKASVALAPR